MKFLVFYAIILYVIIEKINCSKESQVLLSNKEIREILKCFGDLNLEEGCVICRYITQKIYKVLDISAMCPDIVDTKLKYEREREWKPDPQVINKWTVLYNLQKDYFDRIKPSLDGVKNYQSVLNQKIIKEKQEKENLQNIIQFQNKVNYDLSHNNQINNNSFDSSNKKSYDDESNYQNNKIIAARKDNTDNTSNTNNYSREDKNQINNQMNNKNEFNNLIEKNKNDFSYNKNEIKNINLNENTQNQNLKSLNNRLLNDLKNKIGFENFTENKINNDPLDKINSNINDISNKDFKNEANKLENTNLNKLKSAMSSFFKKDDKSAFKFSEKNSMIKNDILKNNQDILNTNNKDDPEVFDLDPARSRAKSSTDFQKIIQNIKLNEGEELQYLGTSIGSPYEGEKKYSIDTKFEMNKINKNTEMNNFDINSENDKFTKEYYSINKNPNLFEQAKNLEKKIGNKSIFDSNHIKKKEEKFFSKQKTSTANPGEDDINNNDILNINNSTIFSRGKISTNNNSNSLFRDEINSKQNPNQNLKSVESNNNSYEDNLSEKNKREDQNLNLEETKSTKNFDNSEISYLQINKENIVHNDQRQKNYNINKNLLANNLNIKNEINNSISKQNLFNSMNTQNNRTPFELSVIRDENQISNQDKFSNLNNIINKNINIPIHNSKMNPNTNLNKKNMNLNNNNLTSELKKFPNSHNANYHNFNIDKTNANDNKLINNNNNIILDKDKNDSLNADLAKLNLEEDNPINREIKKRMENIKKLETLNSSKLLDEKTIKESELILNSYENDFNYKNIAQRIADPPSFLELENNLFENLIQKSDNYNLETQRRGRRRSRFPDPQWDCVETQIAKLVRYLCEEEVSSSYQKYCKPIFQQINTMIESYLYHDNNLEICQNLHMCPVTVDI